MAFFHATFAERIDAILREGLRPRSVDRNFPDAVPGVYLSTDPVLPLGVLVEHVVTHMKLFASPSEAAKRFRLIVIDRSRVNERLLIPDPQIDIRPVVFWLYPQNIDIRNMPILTLDDLSMVAQKDPVAR